MSEIDQQFIEYVVKSLVGKPDAVHIDRHIDEKGVLLELTVDPEDLGRVIGKRGATAQSLRTLLRALGTKNDARYNLKIIDNGVGPHGPAAPAADGDAVPADTSAAQAENIATPVADVADTSSADSSDEPADNVVDEQPEPVEVEAPEAPAPAASQNDPARSDEDQASDRLKRARAELADLDDLDI